MKFLRREQGGEVWERGKHEVRESEKSTAETRRGAGSGGVGTRGRKQEKGSWGEIAEVREKRGKRWAEREKGSGARDRAESVRLERGIGGGSKAGTSMETRKKHGGEADRGGTGEQFKLGEESLRKRRREETEDRKGEAWAEKRRGQSRGCGAWRIWNGA